METGGLVEETNGGKRMREISQGEEEVSRGGMEGKEDGEDEGEIRTGMVWVDACVLLLDGFDGEEKGLRGCWRHAKLLECNLWSVPARFDASVVWEVVWGRGQPD